jgi:hypothetical protein
VKWCVEWSDVLCEVMCGVKWCVGWSDVLGEVMCRVKWYVEWSDILVSFPDNFLPNLLKLSLHFPPSFLTLTSLYLLNCTNTALLLHLITLRQTTVCRTPLVEWSAQRTAPYLTTHTSTPPAIFKPPVPIIEPPQTHTSDRAAIGIGVSTYRVFNWVAACLVLCNTNWLFGYCV